MTTSTQHSLTQTSAENSKDGHHLVNLDAYPIDKPDSEAWSTCVKHIKNDLHQDGCSVLKGFVKPNILFLLRNQSLKLENEAYFKQETVNAYNISLDEDLPADHPAQITMERGNAFITHDQIPDDFAIQSLYKSTTFKQFIAACFEVDEIFQLADPLAALCINVLRPECEHPWHFDTNEFTVSMVTAAPEKGGSFEFSPNIRTPENENFDDVCDVLTQKEHAPVTRLDLQPGDLQLFKGRFSLHRVKKVKGSKARHSAIFAYSLEPGIIGSAERARQIFGRALEAHEIADRQRNRNDQLLD